MWACASGLTCARTLPQVIWGPWDRETSTMRFSLTMAALNLIVKPFLTPAMLELVKRNGSGASSAGFPGASRRAPAACARPRAAPSAFAPAQSQADQ